MSLLDLLLQEDIWEKFYEYKLSLACPKQFTNELRDFIDKKLYVPICERILRGEKFPLPSKSVISKMGSDKKRIVYTYPYGENIVLKLLTWLVLRKYDNVFCKGLFSFRPGKTAKDAVRYLLKKKNIFEMYSYKLDIHDYFNSIPVEMLLPKLKSVLSDDEYLYGFLESLLTEQYVIDHGKMISEKKGIMAGTPVSSFYANLFLSDLDKYFIEKGVIYARYSDDIILFSENENELHEYSKYIIDYLSSRSLSVNPKKEIYFAPGEGFTFLGFLCKEDKVDIAAATLKKLKQKMKRKRDSLARWKKRNDIQGEKAAKSFIRIFNRKLFESPRDNELCWSNWFFPVISTTESLHEIDLYAQDCIRYLISDRHTKARFNVRYDDMKKLGYKCLVHEYYSYK